MPEHGPQPGPPERREVDPSKIERFVTAIDALLKDAQEGESGLSQAYLPVEGSRETEDHIRVVRRRWDGQTLYGARRVEEHQNPIRGEFHNLESDYVLGQDGQLRHQFQDVALDASTGDPLYHDRHPDARVQEKLPPIDRLMTEIDFMDLASDLEEDTSVDPMSFDHILSLLETSAGTLIDLTEE